MEERKFDPSINILQQRDSSLDKLFFPKSVAVVGATEKEHSVGRTVLWNLIGNPFGGTVYPVNPKRHNVLGVKAYPSLSAIPEPVDLAVIITPAATVPSLVEECGRINIPSLVIISAGFKETGESGKKLEKEILSIAKKYNIRIIGPNCLGVMNPINRLNATFAADMALPGSIAFLSQSGALCTAVLDWSIKEKIGFSAFVSIGSMLDVDWGDLITYFGNDRNTRSILIYMESIGDPRSFLSAAREVALTKPIIIIKAGKTAESAKAAVSHTGALAESNEIFNAALRRVGVLRVDSISELFNMAEILAKQPLPKGPNLSIITNAGGPAVIATDALIEGGGKLTPLSTETITKLNEFLPAEWSHSNPIDIIGDASPERYEKTIEVLAKDKDTDGLLIILTPQNMTNPQAVAEKLVHLSHTIDKPLLASWMGAERIKEGRQILSNANIPFFEYPDYACSAFSQMWKYSYNLLSIYEMAESEVIDIHEVDVLKRNKSINDEFQNIAAEGRTILDEVESKKILEAYNIPVVETRVAKSSEEAVQIASEIGFPVVLKVYSKTITHKKEVGGVKLNLNNKDAVKKAFEEIHFEIKTRVGLTHFCGVSVQPMIKLDGYEVILGSSTDPLFGPVVLFGSGGSLVEVFKDSSIGLPPLSSALAQRVMERTKIYSALKKRKNGKEEINTDLLSSIFVKFSNLVTEYPIIKECDINPLLVSEDKIIALDARFVLFKEGEKRPKIAIRPYPLEYIKFVNLGQNFITLRPIRPEDESLMISFLTELSTKSILQRYLQYFQCDELIAKDRLVRICCNDYDREIAILAEVKILGKTEAIGVGRLIKSPGGNSAGVAIVVKDKWQGKSVGTHIMELLLEVAHRENISYVHANVHKENERMLRMCKKLEFDLLPGEDENFICARYSVNKSRKEK